MAAPPDKNYKPNKVNLLSCEIVNTLGETVDIQYQIVEFSVFYDLFAHGIKLELTIVDSIGIVERLPIVGDEFVLIRFSSIPLERKGKKKFFKPVELGFSIYKVTDKQKANQRTEAFVLHGMSHEIINDKRKSVSESFVDLAGHEIVRQIYEDYLKPTDNDFLTYQQGKLNVAVEAENNLSFVFNGIRPFKCIRKVLRESQTKEQESLSSNLIFYKNNQGYQVNTIDNLYKQSVKEVFYYKVGNEDDRTKDDPEAEKIGREQQINQYQILNQIDQLKNISSGMYEQKYDTIDPLLKRFRESNFNYDEEKGKLAHIEDNFANYNQNSKNKQSFGTENTSYFVTHIGDNYVEESKYFSVHSAAEKDSQLRNPRRLQDYLAYEKASRLAIRNTVVMVTITGYTDLEVGDLIEIRKPQNTVGSTEEELDKTNEMGEKYIILAMRHIFNAVEQNFSTVMECAKDSFNAKVLKA